MRIEALRKLLFLIVMLAVGHSTVVTFYVDQEVQQPLDYVEISAVIKANGESLQQTIQDAANIINNIKKVVGVYCQSYAKQAKDCQNIVDTDPYSIRPQYELDSKKPAFSGFVVAHQIRISVKESKLFGKLIDDILKEKVNKINSLQWKPFQEVDTEELVVIQGKKQAHEICQKIGQQLSKIISVGEVNSHRELTQVEEEEAGEGEQDEEDEEQQQEDEEEEQQPLDIKEGLVYFKFVVQCHSRKK